MAPVETAQGGKPAGIRTAGGAAQRLGDVHHVHDVGLDAVAATLDLWRHGGKTGPGRCQHKGL